MYMLVSAIAYSGQLSVLMIIKDEFEALFDRLLCMRRRFKRLNMDILASCHTDRRPT